MSDPAGPVVLDASAVLALLGDEPGAEAVLEALPRATISTVNLSEVVAKLAERGMPAEAIAAALDGLDLDPRPFEIADAYAAGALRPATRAAGLSLGDRACLALAARLGAPALTADRGWQGLAVPGTAIRTLR
ncbi:MAG: type II toxin-antitoxin system VapC family toxin [Rhodospirillales bacterium]|nr:type II toxin-antitoxin system VapC family toxin [Rhodospirillales bacterium]